MGVLDLVLPSACAGCGSYGAALCSACRRTWRSARRREDAFFSPDPGVVVGDALELALAAFAYEGTLRRALQRLKYGGAARLAAPLAAAALPTLQRLTTLAGPGPLVPVPVHPGRLRERGYNQAGLLAQHLGHASGLPAAELLERTRATTKQHRLDRAGRLRNLRGAFSVIPGVRPPPVIILVDDILTTSATLEACASALRGAGAHRVLGITIGREV